MRQLLDRIKNEPALVAAMIIAGFDGLVLWDVLTLSIDQFAWINGVVALLFGVTVRQSVYSPRSFKSIEGELLDQ